MIFYLDSFRYLPDYFIDLDHFKNINDTCGHMTGDRALQQITKILSSSIRLSDTLVRYGGEEFAIIMPATNLTNALDKADAIRQSVESFNFDNLVIGESLKITTSIGVASFPEHGNEYGTIVDTVDGAI